MKKYDFVPKNPVARFFYQGVSHTHPVRRVVLVVDETKTCITGYELREGRISRNFKKAPIKSYRKDKIANFGDYCRLKMSKVAYQKRSTDSTLIREELQELIVSGI